jgi:hypothetical protein
MKKPTQAARIAQIEAGLAELKYFMADMNERCLLIERRLAALEPDHKHKSELDAFDKLPTEMRAEIRHYGLSEMPALLDLLDRGEITPSDFVGRIRSEAARLGIKREPDQPIRRRRIR